MKLVMLVGWTRQLRPTPMPYVFDLSGPMAGGTLGQSFTRKIFMSRRGTPSAIWFRWSPTVDQPGECWACVSFRLGITNGLLHLCSEVVPLVLLVTRNWSRSSAITRRYSTSGLSSLKSAIKSYESFCASVIVARRLWRHLG